MSGSLEPLKARRLALQLRERIANGEIAPGTRLDSEPSLAAQNGVSRVTVRRALDSLATEGLIDRRVGAGTFVREPGSPKPIVGDIANMLAHLLDMGRQTTVRLMSFSYGSPPARIAAALRLGSGERVQRSVRVRLIDDQPLSYLTAHVPKTIGLTYSAADLADMSLLTLLERAGIVVERANQTMSATLAGAEVAVALEVPIGAPLLSVTRVVFGRDGQGVEHLQALYRPDKYAFEMELHRAEGPGERRWSPVPVGAPKQTNNREDMP